MDARYAVNTSISVIVVLSVPVVNNSLTYSLITDAQSASPCLVLAQYMQSQIMTRVINNKGMDIFRNERKGHF